MRKFFPLLFILIIVIFFWRFFFQGLLPIPSDTIIGLYHPFRDLFAKDYPNGIPFKNFLITDPVRQLYPWRALAVSVEKNMQIPLWNPYSFSGYPLLANFQTGAFYPFNLIFYVLPFSIAWSLLIIPQPLLGGLFLYFYLRSLRLEPLACLIGSLAFSLSGFSIAWLEWGNVTQTFMWVPLILLAKDKLVGRWDKKWAFVLFFSEVSMFLAGHLQVLFYALCLTNIYLFLRVYQKSKKQGGNFLAGYLKNYLPFFVLGIFMFAITSIQWIPTLQFILLSARGLDQNYLSNQGWFIPWQNLLQFLAPDFFGNPATLNYFGVWNYGEFVGYIGIAPFILSLFAVLFRRDKKTFFFSVTLFSSLLFALPTPIAKIPYILNIPFFATAQPTRLMAISDFALSILAALGLDFFLKKTQAKIFIVFSLVALLFAGIWLSLARFHFGISLENVPVAKSNIILPILIFALALFLAAVYVSFGKKKVIRVSVLVLLFFFIVFDLLRFGWKFTPFTQKSYLFPQTKSIEFVKKNLGDYRYMTTDSRILAPNFSVFYRLQTVDGYDPLFLKNYAQLISASERGRPDISEPFGFNRIVTPRSYDSKIMDLLGVKYVLSLSDIKDKKLQKVFQEGETRVYENTEVFPRSFFVKKILASSTAQGAINIMFEKTFDPRQTAIIKGTENINPPRLGVGSSEIINYSENNIKIQTMNKADGFFVLTDIYYPTWKAKIDGINAQIFETDFALRGIFIPKGNHIIEFSDHLF